jgi:Rha family phage regulatory protein
MAKLVLNPEYGLYEQGGKAFCDSLQVAESFEKRHADVLRDIERQIAILEKVDERKFALTNFIPNTYRDSQKRKQPMFLLTRDGFTKLVFGYEGEKATKFQIDYITRFNQMEAFIQSLSAAKVEFPAFTEAVMMAHEEPKNYHFTNEINMIYRIVLGMDAKQYKQMHGLDDKASLRPYVTTEELQTIETLQRVDIGLLVSTPDYYERQGILKRHYTRLGGQKLKGLAGSPPHLFTSGLSVRPVR